MESSGLPNGESTDTAKTDGQGKFAFRKIENRTFLRPDLLSANPVVSQTIKVLYNGENYLVWYFRKPDMKLGPESTGVNLVLDCDISISEPCGESRIVRCKHNGVNW